MKVKFSIIKNEFINNNISFSSNMNDNDELGSISSISSAKNDSIIILFNDKFLKFLPNTKAKCCVIKSNYVDYLPKKLKYVLVKDPYLAFACISNIFLKKKTSNGIISTNIHLEKHVSIHHTVQIDDFTKIYKKTVINENVLIESNCSIGPNVTIGKNVIISSNCSISNCIIGDNTIVKPGAVIGGEGFGFELQTKKRIQHLGNVIIGNNCYIGSNTSIDRAVLDSTIVSDSCNLDNLIQIAHNVVIGKGCVIAGQVGIAGSTTIGENVKIGGQAGISGHLRIGNNVIIAAKSGVTKNLKDYQVVAGFPAIDIKKWKKNILKLNKI